VDGSIVTSVVVMKGNVGVWEKKKLLGAKGRNIRRGDV